MNSFNLKGHNHIPSNEEIKTVPSINQSSESLNSLMSSTIQSLIKVAAELDNDDKTKEAEEVHKIIRKYVERL